MVASDPALDDPSLNAALTATEDAFSLTPGTLRDEDLPPESSLDAESQLAITTGDQSEYSEPWNRLPHEGKARFDHFVYYRDLGPSRTFAQTARDIGLAVGSVQSMAKEYNWKDRVLAFDQHEDRIYQIRRQLAIKEMADRHGDLIVETLAGLSLPLKALMERFENDPDQLMADLDKQSTKKLIDLVARTSRLMPNLMSAERLARGMPTEIVQAETTINVKQQIDRDGIADVVATLEAAGAFAGRTAIGDSEAFIDVESADVEIYPYQAEPEEPEPGRAES